MTLLREIQDSAVGTDTSVEVLLRQCIVLAARLHHAPLREWAQLELNGYPDDVPLPEYRPKFGTQVLGDFVGPFGSGGKNLGLAPASIPEQFAFAKEFLFSSEVRQRVAEIENLLASGETSFQIPWPMNFVAALQGCFYQHMNLVGARQIIPATVLSSTLSGIRDRVLSSHSTSRLRTPMPARPRQMRGRSRSSGLLRSLISSSMAIMRLSQPADVTWFSM